MSYSCEKSIFSTWFLILWQTAFDKSLPPHFVSIPVDRARQALHDWVVFSIPEGGPLGEKWVIPVKNQFFRHDFSFSGKLHLTKVFLPISFLSQSIELVKLYKTDLFFIFQKVDHQMKKSKTMSYLDEKLMFSFVFTIFSEIYAFNVLLLHNNHLIDNLYFSLDSNIDE